MGVDLSHPGRSDRSMMTVRKKIVRARLVNPQPRCEPRLVGVGAGAQLILRGRLILIIPYVNVSVIAQTWKWILIGDQVLLATLQAGGSGRWHGAGERCRRPSPRGRITPSRSRTMLHASRPAIRRSRTSSAHRRSPGARLAYRRRSAGALLHRRLKRRLQRRHLHLARRQRRQRPQPPRLPRCRALSSRSQAPERGLPQLLWA